MKKKYISIIAIILFSFLLGEIVSRPIIENNRDIYVNELIKIYQRRYPLITQKNLISVQITSDWWDTYIHLKFEDSTAEIYITALVFVFDLGESWILYEPKLLPSHKTR